jgi:imidazolonepropionase-like amidohydrolase
MKITFRVLVILLCLGIAAQAADQLIAVKAARMFDGKSNALVQNAVVIVRGDKILDVGSNLPITSGAQLIDLGDATLAPGFMDAHTHLTADFSGNYNERRLQQLDLNVSEQAIRATAFARATVEAGFTTVRDLGSRFIASHEFVDVALRNSINKGVIVGPRMLVATKGIGATGGHFDPTGGFRDFLFGREPDYTDGIANGPDEIRKAVRFEVKNGADVIKAAVYETGNAYDDEKEGNLPHTDADGLGVDHGQARQLPASVAGEGESGHSGSFGNVSQCN